MIARKENEKKKHTRTHLQEKETRKLDTSNKQQKQH